MHLRADPGTLPSPQSLGWKSAVDCGFVRQESLREQFGSVCVCVLGGQGRSHMPCLWLPWCVPLWRWFKKLISLRAHTQTLYPKCPASQSAGLINLFSPPDPGELLKRALPLAGGHQMPALNYSSLRLLGERERERGREGEREREREGERERERGRWMDRTRKKEETWEGRRGWRGEGGSLPAGWGYD